MSHRNDNLRHMRSFLTKAAYDDGFRAFLESGGADEVSHALRERYGIEIKLPDSRTIPPKEVCKELLAWSCWAEEYAEAEIGEAALRVILLVVGYAMPLVITAEDAAVAAR